MLSKSDVPIDLFIRFFASAEINVAFLAPTETGYNKSIMDATAPIRDLLVQEKIHDFNTQKQGPENKVLITSYFVENDHIKNTIASLYRPITKNGDPRIWFKDLKKYCLPYNLLAIIAIKRELFVINLSKTSIAESLIKKGFVYDIIKEAIYQNENIAQELLHKIKEIHNMGFIKSTACGDTGVGDTLENALGLKRNNNKTPDYKGIELKSTRIEINGRIKTPTRTTLFTKVPDVGLGYREIVEQYGKIQKPKGSTTERLQLYETCRISRKNAYDLQLSISKDETDLNLIHASNKIKFVSAWHMQNLRNALIVKHKETFWVKANSKKIDNWEYFRYDTIIHTKQPNTSLLIPLLENDKITVDLAAHIIGNKWRDHGILFKIKPCDLPLLFPSPIIYDLNI